TVSATTSGRPRREPTRVTRSDGALIAATGRGTTSTARALTLRSVVRNAPRSSMARSWPRHCANSYSTRSSERAAATSRTRTPTIRSPSGSGIDGSNTCFSISKLTAPMQMANAIARPPTSVSPGYLTSIRKPSFMSRPSPLSHASPRPSLSSSRYLSAPPNATSDRRLASTGSTPSATSRSVSMSRWNPISSSIRASADRRPNIRRTRATIPSGRIIPAPQRGDREELHSGTAQNRFESGRKPAPALQLDAQRAPAARREPVIARTPAVVRRAPLARDQALLLQPLQRRIQRPLVHLQHALRNLLHALADPPPVHRGQGKGLQHEQVERSAQCVRLLASSHVGTGLGGISCRCL